jgi:hypothetical protein
MKKLTDAYDGVNAFHPDFMKTFYPDMWQGHILSSRGSIAMSNYVAKKRLTTPSHGTVFGISDKAVCKAPLQDMKR